MKKFMLMCFVSLCLCFNVFAYSYSAFGGMTGKNILGIPPFFYSFFIDRVMYNGGDLFLMYGITDKIDINVDVNYFTATADIFSAENKTLGWFLMPRYDIGNSNIVALKFNNVNIST